MESGRVEAAYATLVQLAASGKPEIEVTIAAMAVPREWQADAADDAELHQFPVLLRQLAARLENEAGRQSRTGVANALRAAARAIRFAATGNP